LTKFGQNPKTLKKKREVKRHDSLSKGVSSAGITMDCCDKGLLHLLHAVVGALLDPSLQHFTVADADGTSHTVTRERLLWLYRDASCHIRDTP